MFIDILSDTGNVAKDFLGPKFREKILDLFDFDNELQREQVRELHRCIM